MSQEAQRQTVVDFIIEKIHASGKNLEELAEEAGWADPTPLRMVLAGTTKLSAGLVGVVAKTVKADEAELLDILASEYLPGFWSIACSVFEGLRRLTPTERRLVTEWRRKVGDADRQFKIVGADELVAVLVRR